MELLPSAVAKALRRSFLCFGQFCAGEVQSKTEDFILFVFFECIFAFLVSIPCQWPGFSIFKWTFQTRHVVNARWRTQFVNLVCNHLEQRIYMSTTSLLFSVTRIHCFDLLWSTIFRFIIIWSLLNAFEQQLTRAVAEKTGPAVIGIERPGMHQGEKTWTDVDTWDSWRICRFESLHQLSIVKCDMPGKCLGCPAIFRS